jgi:hypothetical protein
VNQGVAEIDVGWLLLNYADYRRRASLEDKKEQDAIRHRRVRDRHASVTPLRGHAVTPSRFRHACHHAP